MHRKVKNLPLLLLLLIGVGSRHATTQNGSVVAVVVSDRNPTTNLRTSDLRQIFSGEKRTWSNGVAIKLFVRGPATLERDALLNLLGMTEREYGQYWAAQVFRGDAQTEPTTLPSNGMQREALRAFPGAVELINLEDVKSGMKVVKIDGRLPSEVGYTVR